MSHQVALSIKQPWAALLVHGLKSVEVRRWATARRGRVFIHAARTPDPRPLGWKLVAPEIQSTARLCGGIIGVGELADCVRYGTREEFASDEERHRNDPSWFESPGLFGFRFVNLRRLPFRQLSGYVRFFSVPAISVIDA